MGKITKKIIGFIICLIISIIFSSVISNVLYLIFTDSVLDIKTINMLNIVERICKIPDVMKMFLLSILGFMLLLVFGIFKIFDLKSYHANTYKVTDDIEIPLPVGKKQTQNGSSWWLDRKKYKNNFAINEIDTSNPTIQKLIELANLDNEIMKLKEEKEKLNTQEQNKIIKDKINAINEKIYKIDKYIEDSISSLKTLFKKGGITIGKKNKVVLKLYLKQIGKIKIPLIKFINKEDVYFISDNLHSLTIGATRSGKTRSVVLESICNCAMAGESIICSDPKGELFEYTSRFLNRLGYNVVTLDFKTPLKSSKYNFLQPVIDAVNQGDVPLAENRAADIVQSLVGEAKGEKIWNDGEKSTIKAAIMAVVMENKSNPEYQNLTNVYHFISAMCQEQGNNGMLIDTFLDSLPKTHPAVAAFAPARIAPSKTRASFFTSALNTLNLFTDSYIATMINSSDIKAIDLATKKTALFMILPDEKVTFYSLCSLFVNQIYMQLVEIADSRGGQLQNRVNFILDEFGNFSAIPNFGGFLTVGGGRKIRFNLFLQSFAQLNDKYDENVAQNIMDNCYVWNYLKTSNDTTAEKISKKIGTYTTSSWSESNSSSGGSVNKSMSMNLSQRALLTPDEVLRINRPYLLVMCSGKNPAMTNAPDLSKWIFNKIMGLGDEEHNRRVRQFVEDSRNKNEIEEIKLWNIAETIKEQRSNELRKKAYEQLRSL